LLLNPSHPPPPEIDRRVIRRKSRPDMAQGDHFDRPSAHHPSLD